MINSQEKGHSAEVQKLPCPPEWYQKFAERLSLGEFSKTIKKLDTMNFTELKCYLGGDIRELPYEFLQILFPDGSDNIRVAIFLRQQREKYLIVHPEQEQGRGATEGVIGYDGRFVHISVWNELSPADRFVLLVGTTCFHYNSDTPGFGDWSELSDRVKY